MKNLEKERAQAQLEVDLSKSTDERRRFGQFATPYPLAEEITGFALQLMGSARISFLEPSFGTGVFYSALLQTAGSGKISRAAGIELDRAYFEKARALWDEEILLSNADFTRTMPDAAYNLLLANPPYVRHHYMSQEEKSRLYQAVKKETGIEVSGLAGLYCYFQLLAHKWLAPGAVSGWLIPSEFMDVNYGTALKKYLLENVRLLRIHRYAPSDSKFGDALVSSCVVWFKNEAPDGDFGIEFSYGGTHDKPLQTKTIAKSELLKETKWTRFPQKAVRCCAKKTPTLGDFFTIKRGLVTGSNKFFILEKSRIEALGLDMSFFKPVLPSPRHLKTDLVEAASDGVPNLSEQFYLLDCELPEQDIKARSPALWQYIQSGEAETAGKYLCRNRKIWYMQEKRDSAPFLCSYMGRGSAGSTPIRFILNLSEAVATNSYLMLYPKETLRDVISADPCAVYRIWQELKDIGASAIEDEGRVYGGGLRKIEPKELAKVACAGLADICRPHEVLLPLKTA
jgi:hypothetical protein